MIILQEQNGSGGDMMMLGARDITGRHRNYQDNEDRYDLLDEVDEDRYDIMDDVDEEEDTSIDDEYFGTHNGMLDCNPHQNVDANLMKENVLEDEVIDDDEDEEGCHQVLQPLPYYDHSPGEVYTIPEEEEEQSVQYDSDVTSDTVSSLRRWRGEFFIPNLGNYYICFFFRI